MPRCGSWPCAAPSRWAPLCFDYGTEGWVRQLAVRRPERRRGLGLALLRHAFGVFHRRGRPSVGLAVDAVNTAGANRVYERAGMHVERRYDRYARPMHRQPPGGSKAQQAKR
jgi:ribosomal protein S18 acetylase RimI-like enzyme